VSHFIIHARKAFLSGLNPSENRNIPPLKYDYGFLYLLMFFFFIFNYFLVSFQIIKRLPASLIYNQRWDKNSRPDRRIDG